MLGLRLNSLEGFLRYRRSSEIWSRGWQNVDSTLPMRRSCPGFDGSLRSSSSAGTFWRSAGLSWRVDEPYIKVRREWTYLCRAVDKDGNTNDFYLSPTRNAKAAKRFLGKALNGLKDWEMPEGINTSLALYNNYADVDALIAVLRKLKNTGA